MTTKEQALMEEIHRLTRIVAAYETFIANMPKMIKELKKEME